MDITLIYLLIALGLILVTFIFLYNSLISKKNRVMEAWSGIEVQLKRRHDLIPNIVSAVQGYATHEKSVFEKITKIRTEAINADSPMQAAEKEQELTTALKSIFALSEAYPDLKANQNFLQLQNELSNTEDKIAAARRFHNSAVNSYNTSVETVPTNIIAKIFGFQIKEYFELQDENVRSVPAVNIT